MRIQKITLFEIEWNEFVFTLLGVEFQGKIKVFEGELLGLHFSKYHLIFEIAFIQFNVKGPFNYTL